MTNLFIFVFLPFACAPKQGRRGDFFKLKGCLPVSRSMVIFRFDLVTRISWCCWCCSQVAGFGDGLRFTVYGLRMMNPGTFAVVPGCHEVPNCRITPTVGFGSGFNV